MAAVCDVVGTLTENLLVLFRWPVRVCRRGAVFGRCEERLRGQTWSWEVRHPDGQRRHHDTSHEVSYTGKCRSDCAPRRCKSALDTAVGDIKRLFGRTEFTEAALRIEFARLLRRHTNGAVNPNDFAIQHLIFEHVPNECGEFRRTPEPRRERHLLRERFTRGRGKPARKGVSNVPGRWS